MMTARPLALATMLAVAALTLAIACTDGDEPPKADPDSPVTTPPPASATGTATPVAPDVGLPDPPGVVEEPAPIVSVELTIAESFPPQYFAAIVSAQPNGCTRFSRFELERAGTLLEITVYNTVPENLAVVLCTAIYGQTMSNVALAATSSRAKRTRSASTARSSASWPSSSPVGEQQQRWQPRPCPAG